MKKYCPLCEPEKDGAICHGEEIECPDDVYCDAKYDAHGNRLNEMAEDEYLRYGY